MALRSKKNVAEQPNSLEVGKPPAQQIKKATLVVPHATATREFERQERLDMLARVPEESSITTHLTTTNYHVDRSIREATLAHHNQWLEEEETLVFTSSSDLKVYLGTHRDPLEIPVALERIRQLGESTALTARIVLGIWNIRRFNHQLAKDGTVAMRVEEVLEWRGIKKHSHVAYPGSAKRYTNGYETKYKEQVLRDLDALASCCVRGRVTVTFKGKQTKTSINGPYLTYSIVTQETLWREDTIVGVFVGPGSWINAYEEYDNYFLAEIDRKIFQFHPQRQQHEIRIALYLTEHWRQGARRDAFEKPITMADLLAASMIHVDKAHLTSQFAPRIENALTTLWEQGIIGGKAEPKPCIPIDTTKSWGRAWLGSKWVIVPPAEVQKYYATTISLPPAKQVKQGRKHSKREATG